MKEMILIMLKHAKNKTVITPILLKSNFYCQVFIIQLLIHMFFVCNFVINKMYIIP